MLLHQCVQRLGQQARVQRQMSLQQQRLIPVRARGHGAPEELALDGQKRHLALRGILASRRHGGNRLHHLGQVSHTLPLEHLPGRDPPTGLAGPRHDLQAQDGIPAQFKEVVLPADGLHTQDLGPDTRQHPFGLALRCLGLAVVPRHIRRRQCLAVDLAVGIQGQLIQHHDQRGHHVVRQVQGQLRLDARRVQNLSARHIGHQARACGQRLHHHDGFAHASLAQQLRLDLAKLDAKAPDLDLVVDAAQVFDLAIQAPAHQVAGSVQALARGAEGVGHEALGRQAVAPDIAAGQADAAQVQLASHALWQQVQAGVQHAHGGVGDGLADGHVVQAIVTASPMGDIDGRFGRAIQVVQAGARQA
ncbi:hypothetical protein AQB9606_04490 [Aquabacterium sp. CECT 9606]|nr:hypothetical protein AQB9606_04490 [Aquabacterium sp. CECT 9606]